MLVSTISPQPQVMFGKSLRLHTVASSTISTNQLLSWRFCPDDQLTVTIPQIYITNNLISGTIRIDIYSTKGELSMNLSTYSSDAFGYKWHGRWVRDDSVHSTSYYPDSFFCIRYADGHRRHRLPWVLKNWGIGSINNAIGPQQIPITTFKSKQCLTLKDMTGQECRHCY